MPLTSLELMIDQNRPGWLTRAGRDAVALLDAQGRPQMAAALREDLSRCSELVSLQTYLRLRVLAGDSPALFTELSNNLHGPADGRKATAGTVPLNPCVGLINGQQPNGAAWNLGAGELLLEHRHDPRARRYVVKTKVLQAGRDWHDVGGISSLNPFTWAASDGEKVALMQPGEAGVWSVLLAEAVGNNDRELWRTGVFLKSGSRAANISLVLAPQALIIYDCEAGRVIALDRGDGRELWSQDVPVDRDYPPMRLINHYLCVLGGGAIHVFDLNTGERLWENPEGSRGGIRFWGADGALYIGRRSGETDRYELSSAEVKSMRRWVNFSGQVVTPDSIAASETIVAKLKGNNLYTARLDEPEFIPWSKRLPPGQTVGQLFIVGKTVLRTHRDALSAYDLESGQVLWEKLWLPFHPFTLWGHPSGILASGADGEACFIYEDTGSQG